MSSNSTEQLYDDQINACTDALNPELTGFWDKMSLIQWAKRYPIEPTSIDIKNAKLYLKLRARNLGCENICSKHMLDYMKNIKPNLSSRTALVWWMYDFFNALNIRLKLPEMSRSEFIRVHITNKPTVEHMYREYKAWQQQKSMKTSTEVAPIQVDLNSVAVAAAAMTAGAGCWIWNQLQHHREEKKNTH